MGKLFDELQQNAADAKDENKNIEEELTLISEYKDNLNNQINKILSDNIDSFSEKTQQTKEQIKIDLLRKEHKNESKH